MDTRLESMVNEEAESVAWNHEISLLEAKIILMKGIKIYQDYCRGENMTVDEAISMKHKEEDQTRCEELCRGENMALDQAIAMKQKEEDQTRYEEYMNNERLENENNYR